MGEPQRTTQEYAADDARTAFQENPGKDLAIEEQGC